MSQMKVEPDFPVPDDKADSLVEPEKLAGGVIFKDDSLKKASHKCSTPRWDYSVYQSYHEWTQSQEEVPDGTFWQCDTCKDVYYAYSKLSLASYGQYGRGWKKVKWYHLRLKRRWKHTLHTTN